MAGFNPQCGPPAWKVEEQENGSKTLLATVPEQATPGTNSTCPTASFLWCPDRDPLLR
jgi:hypothetical protein